MASCDLLLCSQRLVLVKPADFSLPYAAEADERSPRIRHCASFANLIKCCASFNKVTILGKGYKDRWGWWSLASLLRRRLLALARAIPFPQLTRWEVERIVHWAVDPERLEAGVGVTKRDCRGHDIVAVALKQSCLRPSARWTSAVLQPRSLRRGLAGSRPLSFPRIELLHRVLQHSQSTNS
jgi:hypothetical protein